MLGWIERWILGGDAVDERYPVLNEDELEEIRMLTNCTFRETRRHWVKFCRHVAEPGWMTLEEFLSLAAISENPLRDRLALCFGFPAKEVHHAASAALEAAIRKEGLLPPHLFGPEVGDPEQPPLDESHGQRQAGQEGPPKISFKSFMETLHVFNSIGNAEQKLRYAFRIQDFDGDDKLSKDDLVRYLFRICRPVEAVDPETASNAATSPKPAEAEEKTHDGEDPALSAPETKRDDGTSGGGGGADQDEEKGGAQQAPPSNTPPKQSFHDQIQRVAENIFVEFGRDPQTNADDELLSFEEFQRVVGATDFESRIHIPFL